MLPIAIAALLVVAAILVAWILVAYFRSRQTSTDAMLIRIVVGPAVTLMGSAALAPHLQSSNLVPIVCLTVVAVAAIIVVAMKRRHSEHGPSGGSGPPLPLDADERAPAEPRARDAAPARRDPALGHQRHLLEAVAGAERQRAARSDARGTAVSSTRKAGRKAPRDGPQPPDSGDL